MKKTILNSIAILLMDFVGIFLPYLAIFIIGFGSVVWSLVLTIPASTVMLPVIYGGVLLVRWMIKLLEHSEKTLLSDDIQHDYLALGHYCTLALGVTLGFVKYWTLVINYPKYFFN